MNKQLIIWVGLASIIIGLITPPLVSIFAITFWPLSLAGNFILQAMVIASLLAAFFIIGAVFTSHKVKQKKAFLYSLPLLLSAVGALNFLALTKAPPPLPFSSAALFAEQQPPHLRIIHANLLGKSEALDKLIEWAAQKEPDIIALTELPNGTPESATLTQLFKTYPWRTFSTVGGPARTMIISRHEIINTIPLIDHAATAHINISQIGSINIVSIHPPPPLTPLLAFRRNRILENSFQGATQDYQPTIILGDFNAVPWAYPLRHLSTQHGFHRLYDTNFQNTWMTSLPILGLPIDHIYSSTHFAMVRYKTGPFIGSDHYPIMADLIIPKRP